MHTDPALLPRAGKGGEEEEEEGLQQHLSSSGWSHRLGRCTGTPLVLGISGITVGTEGRAGSWNPIPHWRATSPKAEPSMLQHLPTGQSSSSFQLEKGY